VISLIAAFAKNGVIGKGNQMPWHVPGDLKRFRELTRGHPVIMGRKTFESIGKPLPQRRNIVVTRNQGFSAPGTETASSLQEAISRAQGPGSEEIFIIGGAEIYRLALESGLADRLYLTQIEREYEGDAFFPKWEPAHFRETAREDHREGPDYPVPLSYIVLDRI
jgi:dihydrofolate reductase